MVKIKNIKKNGKALCVIGYYGIKVFGNGSLDSATLSKDTSICGVLFKANNPVYFYEIDKLIIKKGKIDILWDESKFRYGKLAKDLEYEGKTFVKDSDIEFHWTGAVAFGYLSNGKVYQPKEYKEYE